SLKCYHCDGHSCSNILSCSGSEDCFTATSDLKGMLLLAKGCVSKSFCNATKSLTLERISCCEANLCNGAQSIAKRITQIFVPLRFSALLHPAALHILQ
ncbi:hypothetical protein QQF64_034401, partial [Cirrhinus molitorella]